MNESSPPATDAAAEHTPPATSAAKPMNTRRGMAWLSWVLLLLLATAGGAGYWGYGMWQQQQQALTGLHGDVAALRQSLNEQLAQQQAASRNELKRLTEERSATQQSLQLAVATLQATLDDHKQQLASLKKMLGQDARHWRLSEIERLLTAAQLRTGALDDPIGARQMLHEAERLAGQLGGESLALRTDIQQLVGALDRSVPLDRDGLASKMFNLAQLLPALPLKAGEQAEPSPAAGAQSDWWSQTKAWFGSWMHIKNSAQPAPLALSLQQASPLGDIAQTLLQARAALLTRHVDEAYRLSAQALMQAQQMNMLDTRSPKVQQALAELRDISAALEQGYRPQPLDFAPVFVALRSLQEPPVAMPPPVNAPDAALSIDPPVDVPTASNPTKEP